MSGRQESSFPSFSRRPNENDDSMAAIRERMDRDREAFFADRQPQGRPRPPFFSNDPTFDSTFPSPDSLTSAFRSPRFGMGNLPGNAEAARNNMDSNTNSPWTNYQQQHRNSSSDTAPLYSGNNDNTNNARSTSLNSKDSIPIRVLNSKPKSKYTAEGRNTTELPGRGANDTDTHLNDTPGETGHSSCLERSHSEPPKTFTQKLRAAGVTPGAGGWVVPGTVPENSECIDGNSPRLSGKVPHYQQKFNLGAPHRNLSTSASVPSVPSHQNRPSTAPPVAPPRRSVPPRVNMDSEKQTEEDAPAVRHIPIFVEGRDEPVFNKKLSNAEQNEKKTSDRGGSGNFSGDMENNCIRKPSDFYPSGVKRVARGATNPPHLDISQVSQRPQEPTSPISPPSGPIPMGYDPKGNFEQKDEPTSPQPPPPGPIPMSCSPNFMQPLVKEEEEEDQRKSSLGQNTSKDITDATAAQRSSNAEPAQGDWHNSRKTSAESSGGEGVHVVHINVQGEAESGGANTPTCDKGEEEKNTDPALEKLQKVREAVADLVEQIESFEGAKDSKEYRYLDEMLTRHMLSLDSIEAGGRDDIRQGRKDAIRSINRCLSTLDARASGKQMPSDNKDADDNNAIIDKLASISDAKEK